MKRLLLPLIMAALLWLACPLASKVGSGGGPTGNVLPQPEVGLDGLEHYQAALTVSFTGSLDGQSADQTDRYEQSAWPKLQAQFTTFDQSGPDGAGQFLLTGSVGQAQYLRMEPDGECLVDWGDQAKAPTAFTPANLLPPVGAARLADQQALDGRPARHYTFDASGLGLPSDVQAAGELWLAGDGGEVLKYSLSITGGESAFGTGVSGTRRLDYRLDLSGAADRVDYPAGCRPVLSELPAMPDAADLVRLPGYLAFSTASSPDEVFAFYTDKLLALGWKAPDLAPTDASSRSFVRPGTQGFALVDVVDEAGSQRVTVMLPLEPAAVSGGPTATPPPASADPVRRVAMALGLLVASGSQAPALPSYHLEVLKQSPVWDGTKIAQSEESMSADVQGQDVHFTDAVAKPGKSPTRAEVYRVGGQDYEVVNGQLGEPGATLKGLAWDTWPVDPTTLLAAGAPAAQAAGSETIEGRPVEVYSLEATAQPIPGVPGALLPVSQVSGKVWVDAATGALLKAVLDFEADVLDNSGASHGSGSGHLEIAVTKIGQVTVKLP